MLIGIWTWIAPWMAWGEQHLMAWSAFVVLIAGTVVMVSQVRRVAGARLNDEVVFWKDLPSWQTLPPRSSRGAPETTPTLPRIVRRAEQAATTIAHLTQELKQTQNRLQYERNRLQSVLSGMGEGVLATDSAGNILLANERAAQLLQREIRELVGARLTDQDFLPVTLISQLQEQTGEAEEVPVVETLEREGCYFRFSATPIPSLAGHDCSGWVIMLLDVTQEKRVEHLKTEFLQTVAHDLRSPLASTMGFAELLDDNVAGELNDLQREFVGEIATGLRRQLALVDSLLDVGRLESGQIALDWSSFDLGKLLREVVQMHQPLAKNKNQTLLPGLPAEPLNVVADRLQMERVMTNLVSNAVKYTPEGGRVEILAERHGEALRVVVKDTGYGIPLADQERLGEKFFRARNEGLKKVKGTGLGLAITKTILAQHGSTLQVESELGQGSTFSFLLPMARECP